MIISESTSPSDYEVLPACNRSAVFPGFFKRQLGCGATEPKFLKVILAIFTEAAGGGLREFGSVVLDVNFGFDAVLAAFQSGLVSIDFNLVIAGFEFRPRNHSGLGEAEMVGGHGSAKGKSQGESHKREGDFLGHFSSSVHVAFTS
jgi:hypothetical protein